MNLFRFFKSDEDDDNDIGSCFKFFQSDGEDEDEDEEVSKPADNSVKECDKNFPVIDQYGNKFWYKDGVLIHVEGNSDIACSGTFNNNDNDENSKLSISDILDECEYDSALEPLDGFEAYGSDDHWPQEYSDEI